MKALIQRVLRAAVFVEGREFSSIGGGLLVFLGVEKGDTADNAAFLAGKLSRLRVFEDASGKMNLSVMDAGGEMLVVSQFTLAADLRKGNRPSFDAAESPEKAQRLYEGFIQGLKGSGVAVKEGVFGARMRVSLENDGPVTMLLESK